jgi:hypothetical protein
MVNVVTVWRRLQDETTIRTLHAFALVTSVRPVRF